MYWVTYSFMRARHASVLGHCGRGQSLATAHVMQWCRLPRLGQAHQIQSRGVGHGGRLRVGDGAVGWFLGGVPISTHPQAVESG